MTLYQYILILTALLRISLTHELGFLWIPSVTLSYAPINIGILSVKMALAEVLAGYSP